MRVLLKDVSDNTLYCTEIVAVYQIDSIVLTNDCGTDYEFEFENVLEMEDTSGDLICIVMSVRESENYITELAVNGYADLTSYGPETFISPDKTDLHRLQKLKEEVLSKVHSF